jgi:hypothetical protein
MISSDPLVWISSILILITISFGFRTSRPWRIVEHILIGGAAGNLIAQEIRNIRRLGVTPMLSGNLLAGISVILGLVLYLQYSSTYRWVSRYPISILVGTGIGVSMATLIKSMFLDQIANTLIAFKQNTTLIANFNTIVLTIFMLTSLMFFIFTFKTDTGGLNYLIRIGRIGLLVAFGAAYAGTSMTYIGVLIDAIRYLLFTWLGL